MEEIWKDVNGYNGVYEVSNKGRVRSWMRVRGLPGKREEPKYISPIDNGLGYLFVVLTNDDGRTRFYIHRLVAKHFIPNPENKPDVNHLDGDKSNNHVNNLKWATKSENTNHNFKNNMHSSVGENHVHSKLKVEDVKEIRERAEDGSLGIIAELAEDFDVSSTTISRVVNRKTWKNV